MITLFKKIIGELPWLLLIVLLSWMLIEEKFSFKESGITQEVRQTSILGKMEAIGKIELVKYNFQEVTEITKFTEYVDLKFFKYKPAPDSKAVLISSGTSAGCIDLTKVTADKIWEVSDTLFIVLPAPELCYFKLDLEKSHIYDLQIDYMEKDEQVKFMDQLYTEAERNIKNSSMNQGILEQTKLNARNILVPIFEGLAGKSVVLRFESQPIEQVLDPEM